MNGKQIVCGATFGLVGLLGGCGGGGGGGDSAPPPSVPPPTTAEGLWLGTTSSGRTVNGLVLDNGEYWVIYSAQNNSAVIAGAVQGTSAASNGNFSSSDARDFNLEGSGIVAATISGSYREKQSFSGIVTYSPTQNSGFSTTYSAGYELTPSLAAVAGTYAGTTATASGTGESATVVISPAGVITGSSAGGCRYSGTITPRAKGNVYNATVTFAGGVCSNGTNTVTGIGYFDATPKRIYSLGLNTTRTNGYIFVGTKP